MRPNSSLLSIALLAAPAIAQFVPSATAVAGSVFANGVSAVPLSPGAAVWGGFARDANATTCSAHLGVGNTMSATAVELQWQLACAASVSGTAASEAAIVYHFTSPFPIVGHFVVTWAAVTNGHGSATCELDLGADGVVDATGSAILPVAAAAGADVALRVHAIAQASAGVLYGPWGTTWHYSGSAQAMLQVRFEPTPGNVQTVAPACGAAVLGAAANLLEGVDFTGSLALANDLELLVLGLAPGNVSMPLPWSTCMLAVDPVVVMWQPVVANATAVWSLHVPAAVRPVGVYAQLLGIDLDAPAVTSSAALMVGVQ